MCALAPQRLEFAHAAFVARTPCLDALANPHFFLREFLVEQRIRLRLRVQTFFAATQIIGVVAGPRGDLTAVDLDDACRQCAQEAAVMGDEDDAAGEVLEEFLEPRNRIDIQMIGRLIEQQQIGCAHERLREQHTPLHAAGQRCEIHIFGKVQSRQHLLHAPIQIPAMLCFDPGLHIAEVSVKSPCAIRW